MIIQYTIQHSISQNTLRFKETEVGGLKNKIRSFGFIALFRTVLKTTSICGNTKNGKL